MNPIANPFAPGAGNTPPELAGREAILNNAQIAIERVKLGFQANAQMLLGLRGVGKTVLLNKIEEMALAHQHLTSMIEAPEGRDESERKSLGEMLYPQMHQVLRKLSVIEAAKEKSYHALRALRSFIGTWKLSYGEISVAIEPEIGVADSGHLEKDLTELFVRVGEAAKTANKPWTLLIDEVQYLKSPDLGALIVALHKISQKGLPVLFFGAGLPQVAALSGNAKSYAERLFDYPRVGALSATDAKLAIKHPIETHGMRISEAALDEIFVHTQGYPYFLQAWGYHCWNLAPQSPIELADAQAAALAATTHLDSGFFKVRIERLTPKERKYVQAMASLGAGPYRSADVAEVMQESLQQLAPLRAKIIGKGMIYSPSHGDIAFTVPLFDQYLIRNATGK